MKSIFLLMIVVGLAGLLFAVFGMREGRRQLPKRKPRKQIDVTYNPKEFRKPRE